MDRRLRRPYLGTHDRGVGRRSGAVRQGHGLDKSMPSAAAAEAVGDSAEQTNREEEAQASKATVGRAGVGPFMHGEAAAAYCSGHGEGLPFVLLGEVA